MSQPTDSSGLIGVNMKMTLQTKQSAKNEEELVEMCRKLTKRKINKNSKKKKRRR